MEERDCYILSRIINLYKDVKCSVCCRKYDTHCQTYLLCLEIDIEIGMEYKSLNSFSQF